MVGLLLFYIGIALCSSDNEINDIFTGEVPNSEQKQETALEKNKEHQKEWNQEQDQEHKLEKDKEQGQEYKKELNQEQDQEHELEKVKEQEKEYKEELKQEQDQEQGQEYKEELNQEQDQEYKEENNLAQKRENAVISLTSVNFQSIKTGDWFVMFYAPWSGYSKRVMPIWEEFAGVIAQSEDNLNLKVGKIDCSTEKATCADLSLIGYPTLILYMDSMSSVYSGIRTIEALSNYYRDKNTKRYLRIVSEEQSQLPSDVEVLNITNFETALSGTVLIMFYAPWCQHSAKLSVLWEEIARGQKSSFRTAKIDCTSQSTLCYKYSIKAYPTVKLFLSGIPQDTYRGERTYEGYAQYVKVSLDPENAPALPIPKIPTPPPLPEKKQPVPIQIPEEDLVIVLTNENFATETQNGPILVKFYAPWCEHCKALAPIWKAIAYQYKDKFTVGKLDCTLYGDICKNQGVTAYPTIKLFLDGKDYLFKGIREYNTFVNFVTKVMYDVSESSTPNGEEKKTEL